jgi:superfamily II helicase
MRPLCKCGIRPRAVNYKKQGQIFYRSLCEICMSRGLYAGIPRWHRAGYKMKSVCDRCGYRSEVQDIFRVYHVDGDLNNCRFSNLKTVCANCRVLLSREKSGWRQGDLIADY